MKNFFPILSLVPGRCRQRAGNDGGLAACRAFNHVVDRPHSGVAPCLPPQSKTVVFLVSVFVAASAWVSTAQAKLDLVCTTPDIASIVKEVGGNKINITTLARPTEDPHFVDAKPSFIVKLNRADVLVEGGAELEIGWLPALLQGARNEKLQAGQPGRILCNQGILMREIPTTLDRSEGDIHAAGNPHFLVDPENAKIVAAHVGDALGQLDAANSDYYKANAAKFIAALDAKLTGWQAQLAPFKGQHIVAYHNSWVYFAQRFGLKIDLFLEPKPGIPPSPVHLASVITKMKEEKARVIIVDPYLNRRTAETVAGDTDATVVDVAQFPGGVKGTEGGYIALMDYLVNSLAKALAGK
jgi:zinc/manganese transport system substrate-binding protein